LCRILTRSKVRCTRCPSSRPSRTRSCANASERSHGVDHRQESYLSTFTHSVHSSISLISPILYFVALFHPSFHPSFHSYSFTLLISPSALARVRANSCILHTTFFYSSIFPVTFCCRPYVSPTRAQLAPHTFILCSITLYTCLHSSFACAYLHFAVHHYLP
jgi:hypothetical protein